MNRGVVDSEIRGRLSTTQEEFIKFVTDKSSSGQKTPLRLWHDIPLEFLCDGSESIVPNVNWYYSKPVFVFAPHLTWPKLKLCCPECDQATISPKGWQSNPRGRYVHDIESSFYLVQYVYQCKNKECIKNIESKSVSKISKARQSMLEYLETNFSFITEFFFIIALFFYSICII